LSKRKDRKKYAYSHKEHFPLMLEEARDLRLRIVQQKLVHVIKGTQFSGQLVICIF
jgi:hypothetical protein